MSHAGWEASYTDDGVQVAKSEPEAALMFFLLRLFRQLRSIGTVPAMDLDAYSRSIQA